MYVLVVVEEAAAHAVFDARFIVAVIQAVLPLPVIPQREPFRFNNKNKIKYN